MGWFGDPEGLEASARRLAADAEAVRDRARVLVDAAGGTGWRGPAAEAFGRAVADDAAALHRAARELDEASAALRSHAAEVRERWARLRELQDALADPLADAWEALT